jgi:PAS domain S-box-containing protein
MDLAVTHTEIRILLIEDDEDDVLLTRDYLSEIENYTFHLDWESDYDQSLDRILVGEHDLYFIDYHLGKNTGIELLRKAKEYNVKAPIILLTGQGDWEIDMQAARIGASDYLVKGEINPQMLERSIRYALNHTKAINELDEKERKYRSLFEKSIDPIFIISPEFSIIDASPSMMDFSGYDADELEGLPLSALFEKLSEFEVFKDTLLNHGQIKDLEVGMKSKKNERFHCQINCIGFDIDNRQTGFQGIIHDLTMRKKAEKELIMAEKLSMTGKIARSIAHEVRNPLTNLNLALEQLKEEIDVGVSTDASLFIDIIHRNANRIEQLISEMLNSSRPGELNLRKVQPSALIDETLKLSIDRIKLREIQLDIKIKTDLPDIYVDPEKLKMAFLNIIINAIEAMETDTGYLLIEADRDGSHLIFKFTDNGKGIAQEDIDKLFDPFYTGKKGGMGLGLTSVQNILQSHKAGIEVRSKPGEGTTFAIYIPVDNC